jgi:hypothetical protein
MGFDNSANYAWIVNLFAPDSSAGRDEYNETRIVPEASIISEIISKKISVVNQFTAKVV